jgi:hypothetical protein
MPSWVSATNPDVVAQCPGLRSDAPSLVAWDVFGGLTPGDVILLLSWRSQVDADLFANTVSLPETSRLRQVRVLRDYRMLDRREARSTS